MEKDNNLHVTTDSPNRYIRMAAKFKSWPLISRFFPNLKEVTESFAAWHHLYGIKNVRRKDSIIIVPGDGIYPRTASIFALRTPMNVICIDPLLKYEITDIARLELVKEKVEDVHPITFPFEQAIIAMVHSHAKLEDCIRLVPNAKRLIVYTMPCCVKHEFTIPKLNIRLEPTYSRTDNHVLSPARKVLIWDVWNYDMLSPHLKEK